MTLVLRIAVMVGVTCRRRNGKLNGLSQIES